MEKEAKRLKIAFLNLETIMDPATWRPPQSKNSFESTKARKEGNELYQKLPHTETTHANILRLYNRSCAFALPASEELALALGNRSALLVHLGRYAEALKDLDEAMNLRITEANLAKYLCRKVECTARLGIDDEARITCKEAEIALLGTKISAEAKMSMIQRMRDTIERMQDGEFECSREKKKNRQLPITEKQLQSPECPGHASDSLVISKSDRLLRYGRHLRTNREIGPGQILYVSKPYVSCPTESRLHSNCSHCLRFVWAALPCDSCALAVYCSVNCKTTAYRLYHDVECRVIDRIWKLYGGTNAVRMLSLRMLVLAFRKAGCCMDELRENVREIDNCTELRKKGFSKDGTVFINDYRSAYSLLTHAAKRSNKELNDVSKNSAVLVYLLAKHTKLFRKYFDDEQKSLVKSENALFVAKLLSHFQHVVLVNATKINDAYNISRKGWNWIGMEEDKYTGLYLNSYLSLLNHSCNPNVRRCEMEDGRTVLYSILPIAKDEQVFDRYGPTYAETIKDTRRTILFTNFYFTCECIACEDDWPMFKRMAHSHIKFTDVTPALMEGISKSLRKCDKISKVLQNGNGTFDSNTIQDVAYGIYLAAKFCKLPNWKLPSLIEMLIAIFNDIYGYVIHMPDKC